jgi:predicted nucleic acid-binding protein
MNDTAVCVDASLVLRLFLGPDDAQAWERWDRWTAEGRTIHAPALIGYEAANALHRYHRAGFLSAASRDIVVEAICALPIRLEAGARLHRRALAVASELALPAAYDAHYLALARSLDAEFWTADARLARQVGEHGPRVMVLGGA